MAPIRPYSWVGGGKRTITGPAKYLLDKFVYNKKSGLMMQMLQEPLMVMEREVRCCFLLVIV